MGKKDFYDYLDDPGRPLSEQDDQELARILEAVEREDIPEPDQAYWNGFNQRLQTRLDQVPRRAVKRQWFRLPAWAGLLGAAMLLFLVLAPDMMRRTLQSPASEPSHVPSLESLGEEHLSLLGAVLEDVELYADDESDRDEAANADEDLDQLLDVLAPLEEEGDFLDDYETIDMNDFKTVWGTEG